MMPEQMFTEQMSRECGPIGQILYSRLQLQGPVQKAMSQPPTQIAHRAFGNKLGHEEYRRLFRESSRSNFRCDQHLVISRIHTRERGRQIGDWVDSVGPVRVQWGCDIVRLQDVKAIAMAIAYLNGDDEVTMPLWDLLLDLYPYFQVVAV